MNMSKSVSGMGAGNAGGMANPQAQNGTVPEVPLTSDIFKVQKSGVPVIIGSKRRPRSVNLVSCSNNILVMGTSDGCVLRCNMYRGVQDIEEIEISSKRPDEALLHIFIDPTGNHTLISVKNGDCYYLHINAQRPKRLSRMQGVMESVAFSKTGSEMSTKSFLVGTNAGTIYEISLDNTGKERVFQQVHQMDKRIPITSLFFDYIRYSGSTGRDVKGGMGAGAGSSEKLFVLCATATPTRLYHFLGGPTFERLFTDASRDTLSFTELPGDITRVDLNCLQAKAVGEGPPKFMFALMTEMGIYHGSISFAQAAFQAREVELSSSEDVHIEAQLLPYGRSAPKYPGGPRVRPALPVSIAMTDFHFLTLSVEKLRVICRINGEVIMEMAVNPESAQQAIEFAAAASGGAGAGHGASSPTSAGHSDPAALTEAQQAQLAASRKSQIHGKPLSMIMDSGKNQLWIHTDACLYKIAIEDEDKDIWKVYLQRALASAEQKLFDLAMQHCKQSEDRMRVLYAQAELELVHGDRQTAAVLLARAQVPFEEAILRLLGMTSENTALDFKVSEGMVNGGRTRSRSRIGKIGHDSASAGIIASGGIELDLVGDKELISIRTLLLESLASLPISAKSQRAMLCTWLCEVYLHQLARYSLDIPPSKISTPSLYQFANSNEGFASSANTVEELTAQFKDFLRNNRMCMDQPTTLSQFASRASLPGPRALLIFYARIMGNYEKVLAHFLEQEKYSEAIVILNDAPLEKVEALIYKCAPVLIEFEPENTVQMLVAKPQLRAVDLLPTILRYDRLLEKQMKELEAGGGGGGARIGDDCSAVPRHRGRSSESRDSLLGRMDLDCDGNVVNFGVQYLRECVSRVDSEADAAQYPYPMANVGPSAPIPAAVYHTYIWMLCKYDDDSESELLTFLSKLLDSLDQQENLRCQSASLDYGLGDLGLGMSFSGLSEGLSGRGAGVSGASLGMDLDHVLRLCVRAGRKRSAVYVYLLMGMPQTAIEEAVLIDIEFAKEIVNRFSSESERKLQWLLIAKHAIAQDKTAARALAMIAESGNALRIEDILPHLPDFTEIDLFKEEICSTLEDFGSRIDVLKKEVSELSDSAEGIVKELDGMKRRGYNSSVTQRCEYCPQPLFSRQFYLFPCSHGMHADCLLKRAVTHKHLEPSQLTIVKGLEDQLRIAKSRSKETDKRSLAQIEYLQNELDGYIAGDCPLCGFVMLDSLAQSLIDEEASAEAQSWII